MITQLSHRGDETPTFGAPIFPSSNRAYSSMNSIVSFRINTTCSMTDRITFSVSSLSFVNPLWWWWMGTMRGVRSCIICSASHLAEAFVDSIVHKLRISWSTLVPCCSGFCGVSWCRHWIPHPFWWSHGHTPHRYDAGKSMSNPGFISIFCTSRSWQFRIKGF